MERLLYFIIILIISNTLSASEESLIKQCDSNKSSACFELGDLNADKNDLPNASVWYKKACELKNQKACLLWGVSEYKIGNTNSAIDIWKEINKHTDTINNFNLR